MAVPTITSVSPSTVWTGGQMVLIVGTNFKVPTIPVPQNRPLPAPTPTVQVLCDGVACTDVGVHSATKVSCRLPAHDPGAAVAITVKNLDASCVPIAGETATKAAAVTYARPDLSAEDDGGVVDRTVIKLLRRLVLDNVIKQVHPDFGVYPFEVTFLGETPALVLGGPNITPDAPYYTTEMKVEVASDVTGLLDLKRPPSVHRFDYTITGYTKNESQNVSLMTLTKKVLERQKFLVVPRDKADATKGTISYPLQVPIDAQFRDTSTPNKDGLRSFTGSFVIRGVNLEDIASFPGESTMEKGLGLQTSEVVNGVAFDPSV